MKKLVALFMFTTLLSCTNDDQITNSKSVEKTGTLSVLDGKMLSYSSEEAFVKEYSDLALLDNSDIQNWISSKKLVSLLNTSSDSEDLEEDVLSQTRVIYSDALKSILNSESKVKINGDVLWLNNRTFYLLSENDIRKTSEQLVSEKDRLEVYGGLLSLSKSAKSLTARDVLPNENRIKTFISGEENFNVPGSRIRHILDLYNETIVFNDKIQSSKMYLRSTLQYRSCSTFRCTWKEASDSRTIDTYQLNGANRVWGFSWTQTTATTAKTLLLSTWDIANLYSPISPNAWYTNFNVSGPVRIYVGNGPWHEIQLSWY